MRIATSSERMVDVGGFRLCVTCAGEGVPTVVFDAGLGQGLDPWAALLPAVAVFTGACAYDRAGVGKSDRGPKPRTSRQMVTELHTLLRNAGIAPPYVMVGHSLGGLNARLYAAEYPAEIAGLVLVDPMFPDQLIRLEQLWGKLRMSLFLTLSYASGNEGSTKQDLYASCAQVAAAGPLAAPLVAISAGRPLPRVLEALFPGSSRLMQEGHAALAAASGSGRHLIAANSDHATIWQDGLVVESIRDLVQAAR